MKAVLLRKVQLQGRRLILTAQEGGFPGEAVFFLVSGEEKIPLQVLAKGQKLFCTLPQKLREGDYTLSERLELSPGARRGLLLWGPRLRLGELLLFPLGGDGGELTLRCRRVTKYDGPGTWIKERLSFFLATALRRFGLYKRSWVVFEKFCSQAQDNGVAFFTYCQKNFPREEARRVFFILDQACPAYGPLKKTYGRAVVPFMGLRHMLLMQCSPLYVASESRYHGYLFRCVPNPVFRNIRAGRHKIFFLQHGVTAQKRVEGVFGIRGYNPMDYVAATSYWEQEIIEKHFGYPRERVPVTGFTRWDFWEDRRNPEDKYILLCPTWRGYLDGKDEAFFKGSEYYQGYQSLLQDEELGKLLREARVRLFFFLHPRLHEMGGVFTSPFPEVSFMPYDGESLPGLLMGAYALITDYSSLAYDGAYLSRPVFFYRFDRETYEKETGGYVSEEELPGPVAYDTGELLRHLKNCMQSGFTAPALREDLFAFRDGRACERTVAFLNQEGFALGRRHE